jgi:FKBP-type peptidyl-prolyl cis-trans isomerase
MKKLSKKEWIAVAVGIAIVFYFFLVSGGESFSWGNPGAMDSNSLPINQLEQTDNRFMNTNDGTTTENGLVIQDTVVGTGEEAVAGKVITVHYTGKLMDGKVFDSSLNRGEPFTFSLGAGQVIQGWEQGFAGMKVGGKRTITIPSTLGYGGQDIKNPATGEMIIPANSTLIFDVELLGVQ